MFMLVAWVLAIAAFLACFVVYVLQAWEVYPAGCIITLTVIAFNLVGDAIRDSLDSRLWPR